MPNRPHLRVMHCSDFHLDSKLRDHALRVMRELANLQRSLKVDAVLVAGDIFDSTRQPSEFIEDVAESIIEFSAPAIAIPGNHDVVYDQRDPAGRVFSLLRDDNIYLSSEVGRTVVTADGRLRVWGRGMPEHSPDNDPLEELEIMAVDGLWNVVMAHGELMTTRNGVVLSSPAILQDHSPAIENVHYVALGHYHYPSQITYGQTIARYSGSASSMVGTGEVTLIDFGEDGIKITSHAVQA